MRLMVIATAFALFAPAGTGNAQDFWRATAGPKAGTVYSLAAKSTGEVFAGTADSGVYRSTVNDSTWTRTSLTSKDVEALVVGSNGYLFAACGGILFGVLYCSTDNGISWSKLKSSTAGYSSLSVNPDGNIFLGTSSDSIYRSTDNGNTWQSSRLGVTTSVGGFAACSGGVAYACSGKNIFKSTDDGQSWVSMYTSQTYEIRRICIHPDGYLFANTAGAGVIRSTDNGATWASSSNGLPITGGWPILANSHGDLFVATGIAGGYGGGVFRSSDLGDNWVSVSSGLPAIWIQSMVVASNGVLYGGGSNSTIYRSAQPTVGVQKIPPATALGFALYQNYPNPFNPTTTINYSIPKNATVTLKILDLLGRDIATLVHGAKSAGMHSVQWTASRFSSGVYLCRLQAGTDTEIRKLVLTK
ncbi:MAG: T9SS type A sorting domain-containing protein [Bacteroidota bacterium]|nr:T9SS type A sorting domain-containing protein [Bacteroidota bacterium]